MPKVIQAVYENGVFKPVGKVDLPEHQWVEINVTNVTSAVERTKALFRADAGLIKFIAEDDSLTWAE
ncbi:MAG: antitoxin family protein [Nitrospira sp.]|nr:antitoxin family protein [Nitrospira sp.]MDH4371726.1 antitoxin family protein [Nitrospira sp.]MDH5348947.1 antitoxin family protein [Nitrospira sp.]MDH5499322.1 antitoxin family protein [Nitrospira sp.]MDH5725571.1 antitoxin family protein [Nitrospira sp.]